jgi:hypothetical protein
MTMGPEPIIRILWMSSRLGIFPPNRVVADTNIILDKLLVAKVSRAENQGKVAERFFKIDRQGIRLERHRFDGVK